MDRHREGDPAEMNSKIRAALKELEEKISGELPEVDV